MLMNTYGLGYLAIIHDDDESSVGGGVKYEWGGIK